eukprot:6989304-Pyramimonas_sp.AAC.1
MRRAAKGGAGGPKDALRAWLDIKEAMQQRKRRIEYVQSRGKRTFLACTFRTWVEVGPPILT